MNENLILVKFEGFDDVESFKFFGILLTTPEVWEKTLEEIEEDIQQKEVAYPVDDFDEICFSSYKSIEQFKECIQIVELGSEGESLKELFEPHKVYGFIPFL